MKALPHGPRRWIKRDSAVCLNCDRLRTDPDHRLLCESRDVKRERERKERIEKMVNGQQETR